MFNFASFLVFLFTLNIGISASAEWESRIISETFFSAHRNQFDSKVPINTDNRILRVPQSRLSVDWRPDFTFVKDSDLRIVIRPQWLISSAYIPLTNPTENLETTNGKIDLTDFYIEKSINDSITFTGGLQMYQWGPAELMNPSNPFFHFNSNGRSFQFREKGQPLIRFNIDWNKNWGTVIMTQPISNCESPWISEEDFHQKIALKVEYRSENPLNYFGLTTGNEEKGYVFTGEYFNWSPHEGWSTYVDVKQTKGKTSFSPLNKTFGLISLENEPSTEKLNSLLVSGIRYEGAFDVRLEYIYNQAGWTQQEFDDALLSLKQLSPYTRNNYLRFQRPGLELLGQQYAYFTLRFLNIGRKKDIIASYRTLNSIIGSSSVHFISLEKAWRDSMTLYGEISGSVGSSPSYLNLIDQQSYNAGLKWSL